MKRFINAVDRLSAAGAWAAGIMAVAALLLVISEIAARSIFGRTIYVAEEYSGYLMSMLTFIGLAYTLREKAHIRMMFLLNTLKGRARVRYNMICMAAGGLFCLAMLFFTWEFFWDSVVNETQSMQISETYLAIPQAFLPMGSALLLLQFLSEFLKCLAILRRDVEGIRILDDPEGLGR
jgi:TRAP-type C4-dicarboxylate transport system permease small subunit